MNKAQRAYFELGASYDIYLRQKRYVKELESISDFDAYDGLYDDIEIGNADLKTIVKTMAQKHKEAMQHRNELDELTKVRLKKFGKCFYSVINDFYNRHSEYFDYIFSVEELIESYKNIDRLIENVINETLHRIRLGYDRPDTFEKSYFLYRILKKEGIIEGKGITFDLSLANSNLFVCKNAKASYFSEEELKTPFLRLTIINEKLWDLLDLVSDKSDADLVDNLEINKANYTVDIVNYELYKIVFGEADNKEYQLAYKCGLCDKSFLFEIVSGYRNVGKGRSFARWFIKDPDTIE